MAITLKRADIFLVRGTSWLSGAIRFVTRTIGESRTQVNHVGLIVEDGPLKDVDMVEAVTTVKHHGLWTKYGPPSTDSVAIYRPMNLTDEQIDLIVDEALRQVGKSYGYFKAVAHFLDWVLLGAYVFRRKAKSERYPICSWLVADVFKKAGKHFGVAPGAASPDDIWDFIQAHPDIYEMIHPLKPLEAGEEPPA